MFRVPEKFRIKTGPLGSTKAYGNNGAFQLTVDLFAIASDGEGWEHVSVSRKDRTPTWEEMCTVKNLFWEDEDVVIQFHPAKSQYINNHPYCLHLWRRADAQYDLPPSCLVGI